MNTPLQTILTAVKFHPGEVRVFGMRVLLRQAAIELYYAGRKHWVGNPESAMDLKTIERATELSRDESFERMEVFVIYDTPDCELVLPVGRKGEATDETLLAGHTRSNSRPESAADGH